MDREVHWEEVYRTRPSEEVSWYQAEAQRSLALIKSAAPGDGASIIDVGGGASVLVDGLLEAGYTQLTVLDVSATALSISRQRLQDKAAGVSWLQDDVLEATLPKRAFDCWHDRAVFHFLTREQDRRRYVAQVTQALRDGGHVVIAAFAEHGPTRCSGLQVQRHSPESLQAAFGPEFRLVTSETEIHLTPAGREQAFVWCVFRYGGE